VAIERGAVAVLTDREDLAASVPVAFVRDARAAFGAVAECIYGSPSHRMPVIGVTGTNGKTTTTWILDEALTQLGARPALLGTVESRGPGFRAPSAFTTPEADETSRFAKRMLESSATHLVMEVSSHALTLHRVDGLRFDVAVFTNLTQDHLDFHGSMEAYFEAKAKLFTTLAPRVGIVRIDDAWGEQLAARIDVSRTQLIRVSRNNNTGADVFPASWTSTREGLTAEVVTPWGKVALRSQLIGGHNLENLLFAIASLGSVGFRPGDIAAALASVKGAPGRLERVPSEDDIALVVDYAHTPDALDNAINALRPLTPGRLFVVFGCGGDRDRTKRPLMGRAATRADIAILTSDNPRTEEPAAILADVEPAITEVGLARLNPEALATASRGFYALVDRREAIGLAVAAARPGDTVLIAGKGHENYQILGTTKIHFDDREEAAQADARRPRGQR
jgi:UDP-N-acetylmuramoyl-L-alanyl-D-glutamate--2,6-diaminopimelate ligase